MSSRPRPGRFVDASRVLVTVARGKASLGVRSAADGSVSLARRGPLALSAATQLAIVGVGRSIRGAGNELRRLAGHVEKLSGR